MMEKLLELGTSVETKRGPGYVVKVDTITYAIPMYHVLLVSDEYAGEIIYISDPRVTPELYPSAPDLSIDELNVIRAELAFSIKRNLITGTVVCPQCRTRYYEVGSTEIIDIDADDIAFYCVECGERL